MPTASRPHKDERAHRVVVLALPGVIAFDLATPCEIFGRATRSDGRPAYELRVCGETAEVDAGAVGLTVRHGLSALRSAQTIVVPGRYDPTAPVSKAVVGALRRAAARGTRIASICVGTFTLAQAGLLNGLRATTHWAAASELARLYPDVTVDPNVLFVDNGDILTSAGAAAGLDLCIHIVRADFGAASAALAARLSVVPLQRDGGQAQFIPSINEQRPSSGSMEPLLAWMMQHLREPITIDTMARQAKTSSRTLTRRFLRETGSTPTQWLIRARVRRAQVLLETTSLSIEDVVPEAGFRSAANFRLHFVRMVGVSPLRYRQAFRHEGGDRS